MSRHQSSTLMFIYGLVDPRTNEIRYVGKSNRPDTRVKEHCQAAHRLPRTYCHRWINALRALGLKPRLVILQETTEGEAEVAERAHIARLRHSGAKLTNLTLGGTGFSTGEQNPNVRFTDDQVITMLERYCAGERMRTLTEEYGISESSLCRVIRGDVRPDVGSPGLRQRASQLLGNGKTGSRQWMSKLRDEDIPEIIRLYNAGLMQEEIAARYGVQQTIISRIVSGKGWKHVSRPPVVPGRKKAGMPKGSELPQSRITDEKVHEILALAVSGVYPSLIAEQLHVSRSIVEGIMTGRTWKHVERPVGLVSFQGGEHHWNARFKIEGIREIRRSHAAGESQASIARRYQVSRMTIACIVQRKTWAHVTDEMS